MRCFISLNLSRESINTIKDIQKSIKKHDLFNGKFTELGNLHLTLKFLGEVKMEKVEEIKKRLNNIEFREFEIEFGEVGVFSKKFIKIIWIKIKGANKLQKKIDGVLKDLFEPEERFMGHITIARVKKVDDREKLMEFLKSIKLDKRNFKVKNFHLMKSELFSEGPSYLEIRKYNLES